MQSLYIRDIHSNKYKYYYIPSLVNDNLSYNNILDKCIQLPIF